ncbi:MAG: hypothetical protein HYU64_10835 [Armatimonadetes bacterium]|nr:hypothetical protein [Armatimonadota bacterium]
MNKSTTQLAIGLLLAIAVFSNCVCAQGLGKSKSKAREKATVEASQALLPPSEPVFTERQLRVRGKLPPGLQKKVQSLPFELERRLTVLPTGYRRVVIAGNVILMNEKTALIYDIIRQVIR